MDTVLLDACALRAASASASASASGSPESAPACEVCGELSRNRTSRVRVRAPRAAAPAQGANATANSSRPCDLRVEVCARKTADGEEGAVELVAPAAPASDATNATAGVGAHVLVR